MNESPVERCDEDDPHRCQNTGKQGQCRNLCVDSGNRCMVHGGNKQLQSQELKSLNNFRLGKWQAHIERHAGDSDIKSLRNEIGILRVMIEERLMKCKDATDLIMQSTAISDLVMKVDRVVTSCHKLEGSMGQLLDKSALLQFASQIIDVISVELEGDDEKLETIANGIIGLLNEGEES
ncbi:MAG: hypothetical protein ACXABY_04905 [Candidatus Thorarchaeota archaeon]